MQSVRRLGAAAILACCLGFASVAQGGGENQLAHFALIRSLTHGTAVVDPYLRETKDLAWYHHHYYSTKAPGLAFLTVGPYFLLDRSGVLAFAAHETGATKQAVALWALGLIGAVLPIGVLMFLLRDVGDSIEPGFGTAVAVTAGLATLLFPFATLFFDHALSAALGFAAFALLWHARGRLSIVAAAGLTAGLAVVSEYPLALVAGALGLYAISERAIGTSERLRRGAIYGSCVVLGTFPLLLYDWWAFGSPFHLSYKDAILRRGVGGHDVLGANAQGFFGVSTPQRGVAMHLVFGYIGLFTLTPVVAAGAVGLLLLWSRGLRREAVLCGGLSLGYLVYNSGYVVPFGGGTPGPRFLIPMLPFLALGFATAYRSYPWATLSLAVPSALVMLGVTATGPIEATNWGWTHRVVDGSFTGAGVWPKVPLGAFFLAGVVLCALATPVERLRVRTAVGAAFCFLAYIGIAFAGPRLVGTDPRLLLAIVAFSAAGVTVWHTGIGRFARRSLEASRDPP